jgi:hypothetical protein
VKNGPGGAVLAATAGAGLDAAGKPSNPANSSQPQFTQEPPAGRGWFWIRIPGGGFTFADLALPVVFPTSGST